MKIKETCSCGAVFEIEANDNLSMSIALRQAEFHNAHAPCRKIKEAADSIVGDYMKGEIR